MLIYVDVNYISFLSADGNYEVTIMTKAGDVVQI